MTNATLTFANSPLRETALSLQFDPVPGLSNAVQGGFWYSHLRETYPSVMDAQPIEPQFERFGDDRILGLRTPMLKFTKEASTRLRASTENGERMVQLQNGRLVVNWLKVKDRDYPRFGNVLEHLTTVYRALYQYLEAGKWPLPRLNQWEVTYINVIPQGDLWATAGDIPGLFPGLLTQVNLADGGKLDSIEGNWSFAMPGDAGRLHVELTHGWGSGDPKAAQAVQLQLTARGGPGTPDINADAVQQMNIGHEMIVNTFAAVTSARAQRYWGRQ